MRSCIRSVKLAGMVRRNRNSYSAARRYAVALACLLLAVSAGAAPGTTEHTVPALLDLYSRHSAFGLPAISSAEIAALESGDAIVKVSGAPAPPGSATTAGTDTDTDTDTDNDNDNDEIVAVGVYGLQVVAAPRLLIWLTVMGGNDERDERLTTAMLSRGDAGSYLRYQHINLPWPVRDRHWVIYCEKNPQIALDSDGVIWEHRWSLAENGGSLLNAAFAQGRIAGLSVDDLSESIYLPENQGAWAMLPLDANRTLVIAYLDADLGGRFPAAVVRRFTRSNLKAGLASLRDLSSRVHLNYASERPIHNGFGNLVSEQEAMAAAAGWQDAPSLGASD